MVQPAIPSSTPALEPLLEAARDHDLAAFEALFRLTHREVTRALGHLVDAGRLEPSIEQAYLALLKAPDARAPEISFRALFQKTVVRVALAQPRLRRSADPGRLHGLLGSLSPRPRIVFALHEILGSTVEEIVDATGFSRERVLALLRASRLELAAAVRRSEGLPLTPHDVAGLWALAAGELAADDAALVRVHLEDCPDCREDLALVESLRGAAAESSSTIPKAGWDGIARRLAHRLEKRAPGAAASRLRAGRLVPAAAVLLAIAVAGGRTLLPASTDPAPDLVPALSAEAPRALPAPPPVPPAASDPAPADAAQAAVAPLVPAASPPAPASGLAVVDLPGSSRLGLGGDSRVKLTGGANGAGVRLEHGRVVVQASGSVEVSTGGFSIRGPASRFLVARVRGGVEVAVARGRVHVERPNALPMLVNAGSRVVFARGSVRTSRAELTPRDRALLEELRGAPRAARASAPPEA